MRAERDRRAAILTAEGTKQSAILTAEGERQAAILAAEGEAQARILAANAEAQAIETVFNAVHDSEPGPELLSYQYLQTLPEIAKSDSNTMWVIPGEFGEALKSLSGAFSGEASSPAQDGLSFQEREKERAARAERLRQRRQEKEQEAKDRKGKPGISDSIADLAESARTTSVTDDNPNYVSSETLEEEARKAEAGHRSSTAGSPAWQQQDQTQPPQQPEGPDQQAPRPPSSRASGRILRSSGIIPERPSVVDPEENCPESWRKSYERSQSARYAPGCAVHGDRAGCGAGPPSGRGVRLRGR